MQTSFKAFLGLLAGLSLTVVDAAPEESSSSAEAASSLRAKIQSQGLADSTSGLWLIVASNTDLYLVFSSGANSNQITVVRRAWAESQADQRSEAIAVLDPVRGTTLSPSTDLFLEWTMDGNRFRLPILTGDAGTPIGSQLFIQASGEGNQIETRMIRILRPTTSFLDHLKDVNLDVSRLVNQLNPLLGGLLISGSLNGATLLCTSAIRNLVQPSKESNP